MDFVVSKISSDDQCECSEESRDLMLAEQVGPEGYKPLAEIDMVDLADKEETSAEVSRLREIDDASQPAKQRLKKLVEKLIADAVERDDKTLTKVCSKAVYVMMVQTSSARQIAKARL